MIRKGYLESGWGSDGNARGKEPFVAVDWDTALDIATSALERVRSEFGNASIFAGSYGWASAGRFHHAQGHLKRFLGLIGGFTYSKNTYSFAAAEVIMPHVLGMSFGRLIRQAPTVDDIAAYTDVVVCFGGIALKNTQVMQGGLGAHTATEQLRTLSRSNAEFVNVSPLKDDMADFIGAEWWPLRPNSDVALMLGLAHTIVSEELHDREFLSSYCTGFERFLPYLTGEADGQPKDAEWAASISDIQADKIRDLARRMATGRTLIGISWSLQRAEHGEQTYWMATLLSALLGQVGLPGGGVAYGYGSVHNIGFGGRRLPAYKTAALDLGRNSVETFIPVARISDLLLHPGAQIDYNGDKLTFPDIKLVYWAGGNPFHHHQDLNRLSTTSIERNDFSAGPTDCFLTPMRKAVEPYEQSRSDFEIFSGLAARFGVASEFTHDRDDMGLIEKMYMETRESAAEAGVTLPDFAEFWNGEQFSVESQLTDRIFDLEKFRENADANALGTPSGKIELYSDHIASFGYDDCIGHPMWYDKSEWLGSERASEYPLHLISNQPKTRLHSQYDHAITSRTAKLKDREIVRVNPEDASARNVKDGDIVRIFNDRGACLAAVVLSEKLRRGVIELPTGAWFDPERPDEDKSLEVHGNPNVLTRDVGTSSLAQGPTAHSCLVEVERYEGDLPAVTIFSQPTVSLCK
jgi:biotin/methionine sulfoxide reductase